MEFDISLVFFSFQLPYNKLLANLACLSCSGTASDQYFPVRLLRSVGNRLIFCMVKTQTGRSQLTKQGVGTRNKKCQKWEVI